MKRLYNPILGGKHIRWYNFPIDSYMEFDDKEYEKVIEANPFLIDADRDEYKASYNVNRYGKTKKNLKFKHKILWLITKIKSPLS